MRNTILFQGSLFDMTGLLDLIKVRSWHWFSSKTFLVLFQRGVQFYLFISISSKLSLCICVSVFMYPLYSILIDLFAYQKEKTINYACDKPNNYIGLTRYKNGVDISYLLLCGECFFTGCAIHFHSLLQLQLQSPHFSLHIILYMQHKIIQKY